MITNSQTEFKSDIPTSNGEQIQMNKIKSNNNSTLKLVLFVISVLTYKITLVQTASRFFSTAEFMNAIITLMCDTLSVLLVFFLLLYRQPIY